MPVMAFSMFSLGSSVHRDCTSPRVTTAGRVEVFMGGKIARRLRAHTGWADGGVGSRGAQPGLTARDAAHVAD